MIDRTHPLSLTRQARALGVSRGSVYYVPRPVADADLALMRRLDALHLDFPYAGARLLRRLLQRHGVVVGRRHVRTLMRRMGISAIAPQPGTSRRHRAHPVFPYLLRHRPITRPNQVWAMDITYIPMARGFVFLAAVMDWASRRVLSWRVSITLDSTFCCDAVAEALARHGRPAIFNTDQGASLPVPPSPGCSRTTASRSAWTGRAAGRTTSSSNASGARSSTRKSISTPTPRCPRPKPASAATSRSTTPPGRTRVWRIRPRTKPISPRGRTRWPPNMPARPVIRPGYAVQKSGTTSDIAANMTATAKSMRRLGIEPRTYRLRGGPAPGMNFSSTCCHTCEFVAPAARGRGRQLRGFGALRNKHSGRLTKALMT